MHALSDVHVARSHAHTYTLRQHTCAYVSANRFLPLCTGRFVLVYRNYNHTHTLTLLVPKRQEHMCVQPSAQSYLRSSELSGRTVQCVQAKAHTKKCLCTTLRTISYVVKDRGWRVLLLRVRNLPCICHRYG